MGAKTYGRIILGASTIPSEYILPQMLKAYHTIYPEVKPQLRISGTSEVIRWLRERTIDVAVTGEPLRIADGIQSFALAEDNLKLIIPTDFDGLSHHGWLEMLAEADWIMREPKSDTRRTLEGFLKAQGIHVKDLNVSGQVESTEAVIASVEAGFGISIVSSLAAERSEKLGRVKVVDIPNLTIHRRFYCSYLEDQRNQSVISSFLSFLRTQKK